MSQPVKFTDVERTAAMLDALRRARTIERAGAESAIVLTEVPAMAGYGTTIADALVLNIWQSAGRSRATRSFRRLDGYELKASRSDLKRELARPDKGEGVRKFCDTWSLVAFDEKVYSGLDIPGDWGLYELREHDLVRVRTAPLRTG